MTNDVAQSQPETAPFRVHIAGASLGGLMAGLELRSAGCDVTISERSDRVMDDRGAGIVICRKPRSRKRLWLIGIVTWSTTP
jgi:2-polyprenyl-6-methoxyphenol hydroxylase-like FAD-dependent oxidoreductase